MSEFTDILLVAPMTDGKTWVIQQQFKYFVGELDSEEIAVLAEEPGKEEKFELSPELEGYISLDAR